jgi:hypothetical protein
LLENRIKEDRGGRCSAWIPGGNVGWARPEEEFSETVVSASSLDDLPSITLEGSERHQ